MKKIPVRLIYAIASIIIEELAIFLVVIYALPEAGILITPLGLAGIMVFWLIFSITAYRIGSAALSRKSLVSLPSMLGGYGKTVTSLAPIGMVSINGELWQARASNGYIEKDAEIVVTGQKGLKLTVSKTMKA